MRSLFPTLHVISPMWLTPDETHVVTVSRRREVVRVMLVPAGNDGNYPPRLLGVPHTWRFVFKHHRDGWTWTGPADYLMEPDDRVRFDSLEAAARDVESVVLREFYEWFEKEESDDE